MKRLLVTGGCGFIGSNFVRHELATYPEVEVTNLDALTYAGSPNNLRALPIGDAPDRYRFVHGDICDFPLVDRLLGERAIDTIIHLAAETHVDRSIVSPARFIETNITGTFTLLEAARTRSGLRFHHVSTDEVYGSLAPDAPAATEGTPYAPSSPYAASKAAADHLVRSYVRTYGLDATISSSSNNYGPHQFPEKLIPLMIVNALQGKPLPIYGDGLQVRDWLHVADHCEAIALVAERGASGETYHVAGNVQPTNKDLIETVCALLDARLPASPNRPHRELMRTVTDRPGHDRRYALDASKIARELGWTPRHQLADGLAETVDWYIAEVAR